MTDNRPTLIRLFFGVFFLAVAFSGGHFYSMDDHTNYQVVHALWTTGSPEITISDADRHLNTTAGREGRRFSYYGLGGPLAYLPFYLAGRAAGVIAGPVHYLSQAGMALTNAFMTALASVLIVSVLTRLGRTRTQGLLAAVTYAFATPALVWSKGSSNSVIVGTFFMLALDLLLRERSRLSYFFSGVVLGWAVNVRYDAVIGAILIPAAVIFARKIRGRDLAIFISGAFPFGLLLIGYNVMRFGEPFKLGYPNLASSAPFGTPLLTGAYGLLFSPNRGLFFYAPVLLLATFGWFRVKQASRPIERALFLGLPLAYALFFGKAETWDGGVVWGPRYLACILPLFCCSLANLPPFGPRMKSVFSVLAAVSLAVQLWGGIASIDSYHDYLVDHGIDPLLSRSDPKLAPLWGISHVVSNFNLTRLPPGALNESLPAGGYPITISLRSTPDFWPFYAWKSGVPAALCLTLWGAVFSAGIYCLFPLIRVFGRKMN